MIPIAIDRKIKGKCPLLKLNALQCQVSFSSQNELLWLYMSKSLIEVRNALKIDDISKIPAIQKAREAYKALGKDPSRYRLSAEALLRRILQGKDLYKVNNIIDVLNIISIQSGISIGGYDADRIQGKIILSTAGENEEYYAIGRGLLNISHLPVLRDAIGSFGNPTSDSERTCVTDKTKNFLMVFFNFEGISIAEEWLNEAKILFMQYAQAKDFSVITYE
jgi:DNA/RNA-binding domain of Phe-tRNA-synthetase-like protein